MDDIFREISNIINTLNAQVWKVGGSKLTTGIILTTLVASTV